MESIRNKKAYFNYEIIETLEAGLKLSGNEVKSIKNGRVSFEGSYISFRDQEAFWVNGTVPAWQPKNAPAGYEPTRERKLLLSKKEIDYLRGRSEEKGLTAVPLRVYTKKGRLKMEIGLVSHKKKWDKRETLKKKAQGRDIEREVKRGL